MRQKNSSKTKVNHDHFRFRQADAELKNVTVILQKSERLMVISFDFSAWIAFLLSLRLCNANY